MSRDHISLLKIHVSDDADVYRVCEAETVGAPGESTLAIAIVDRRKGDASIVPCGVWSGEHIIDSVLQLFAAPAVVNEGRLPQAPYGHRRMNYLLAELHAQLRSIAASRDAAECPLTLLRPAAPKGTDGTHAGLVAAPETPARLAQEPPTDAACGPAPL